MDKINSPRIIDYKVIPVAGYDSCSLTLSGAHSPFFTRNIVLIKDSSGNIGIGEVHGGEKTKTLLENCRHHLLDKSILDYREILSSLKFDNNSEGIQYLDISKLSDVVNYTAAIESALLDLVGKLLNKPVCSLLGEGQQRTEIPTVGYMFFVADKDSTGLPYLCEASSEDDWFSMRREAILEKEDIIKQAQVLHEKYGFEVFKLKGGVFPIEKELDIIRDLSKEFPDFKFTIDPNGAWSLKEAVEHLKDVIEYLHYIEDPCSGERGYSGREIMSEFKQLISLDVATNMIATDWKQLYHCIVQESIDIVLADPHFWTMSGAISVSKVLNEFGLKWGSHSNNHFDISLAMFAHTAAAAVGPIEAIDTHWIWQDGQNLCTDSHQIKKGKIVIENKSGLGINIDFNKLKEANNLYNQIDDVYKNRDDSYAMKKLIPNWVYDNKKPAMVR